MSQVITFCHQTINKVNQVIEKTKGELNTKLDRNEREEIISALEKNDELNRRHRQQRKTKKFNYLKFKPKNQSPQEKTKKSFTQKKEPVLRSCIKKEKQNKSST